MIDTFKDNQSKIKIILEKLESKKRDFDSLLSLNYGSYKNASYLISILEKGIQVFTDVLDDSNVSLISIHKTFDDISQIFHPE